MKAFILAAGLGTRLRSLGLDVPKVMVPIGGKPLLEHHFELFKRQGISEFIVNLHYLPEKITSYFGDGSRFGVSITYSHEPKLLGTAGAVKKMESELRGGAFIVFYGDNLVRVDFAPLLEFHRARQAQATVALFASPEPWTGGVVETDSNGRVLRFVEKPDRKQVSTNRISAGILVLEPQVLDMIPAGQFYDFGWDVFPKLLAERRPVYAMEPKAYIQDVGTPERLAKAQRDFEEGSLT
ncbi:MAG: NDP-sugar synthase [Verrucomicrobiia bacterium]|jgi:NDP-sugar pyrophosphorylase family protein